jgi:8-oxo-dGTP pyrophosphatase MutT (NUDIX family)
MTRGCVPDHLTGSALIMSADSISVLLTLHARLGRWLQTGGHCEDDATLAGAALREATEESGVRGLVVDPVPVLLSRHEVQFLCVAPPDALPAISEESRDLAWFPVDGLPVDADDSVRALVRACRDRLGR